MHLLLITAAAAWFMAGVGWLIQVVHYPLFASVGEDAWSAYHEAHSRLVTFVVLPAMSTELVGAVLTAAGAGPDGTSSAVAWAGAACALATFALTGAGAVPAHASLSRAFSAPVLKRLLQVHLARTFLWSAHGVLAVILVSQAAG